VTKSTSLYLDF